MDDKESDDDLKRLLAPGASLGGARPKAAVLDNDGQLMIAKFPSPTDDWPVPRWEAVAMDLARAAGINVPPARLLTVLKRPIFVMGRFDRDAKGRRIPFISGLTALRRSEAREVGAGCVRASKS